MANDDIILQTKIKNPIDEGSRGDFNWNWVAPIKIQRDGSILLEGKLSTNNAVDTNNISDKAINGQKIEPLSIRGAANPANINNNDPADLTNKNNSLIGKETIGNWNIANQSITLDKLDQTMKIPKDLLDISSVLPTYVDEKSNDLRPIRRDMLRHGIITHSKLLNKDNNYTAEYDEDPPVRSNNIADQSILFNHMTNPDEYEIPEGIKREEETKYPINGRAHIQRRSIPLNRLAEPLCYLKEIDSDEIENDYELVLYSPNSFDNGNNLNFENLNKPETYYKNEKDKSWNALKHAYLVKIFTSEESPEFASIKATYDIALAAYKTYAAIVQNWPYKIDVLEEYDWDSDLPPLLETDAEIKARIRQELSDGDEELPPDPESPNEEDIPVYIQPDSP